MKKIGIIVNRGKRRAAEVARTVVENASRNGIELFCSPEDFPYVGGGTRCDKNAFAASGVEAVICIGGDGTILRAARELQGCGLPMLGINTGTLGYLTAASVSQTEEAIAALRDGTVVRSARAMLAAKCIRADGREVMLPDALNEFVLSRGDSPRVAEIAIEIDGAPVTTFVCDGVITSTATGSTAYSLSAGGPVILPEANVFAIDMICPHTLGARPLVVSSDSIIALRSLRATADKPAVVSADGNDLVRLASADRLELRRSPRETILLNLPGHNRFDVLSGKLGWGGERTGAARGESGTCPDSPSTKYE